MHDFFDRSNASLLDAPTGRMIAGFAIDAAWNGNDRIVLANIFLPPDHVIEGLGETPAVVELEVHSRRRSEEHTSELQSLMRISYAVFCLKKKTKKRIQIQGVSTYKKTDNMCNNNIRK